MKWPASEANRVLAALLRIGWSVKRRSSSSHCVLQRNGWADFVFAFHEVEFEILGEIRQIEAIATGHGIRIYFRLVRETSVGAIGGN